MIQRNGNGEERGCLPGRGERGSSDLRPSWGIVLAGLSTCGAGLADSPPTGTEGRTHMSGRAEEGHRSATASREPVNTCSVEQTLSPSPRLPGKKLGPVVARYPDGFPFLREDGNPDFYAKSHYYEMFVTNLKKI